MKRTSLQPEGRRPVEALRAQGAGRTSLLEATREVLARHWPWVLLANELRGLWTIQRVFDILALHFLH